MCLKHISILKGEGKRLITVKSLENHAGILNHQQLTTPSNGAQTAPLSQNRYRTQLFNSLYRLATKFCIAIPFVWGIPRWNVDSPHKGPVIWKKSMWWCHYDSSGGRFKNAYELLNLRALKMSKLHKNHIFQCMGKIFCVEFQRVPLKFHTKYLTHTLKDVDFIHIWKFKSS